MRDNLIKELDSKGVIRNAQNPIFFFLDGHKSHYSYKFIMWCRQNFIIIITFFPNATRILQMRDVAMFGAGKKHWIREVQRWKLETKNAELDEVSFVKILKKVNDQFITKESIINGFRVTGIQPFNVENVFLIGVLDLILLPAISHQTQVLQNVHQRMRFSSRSFQKFHLQQEQLNQFCQ